VDNPQELFEQNSDDLIVDLESKVVLEGGADLRFIVWNISDIISAHLQCAGYEMPLSIEDEQYFGPSMREVCDAHLIKDKDGWQGCFFSAYG
jgi:DEAD/DEAH box helicase domain-containing protein